MRSRIHVGLEIGTSKICAVVSEFQGGGTAKILGVGEVPSRGIRKGEIVDYETALKCVHDALSDAEDRSDTRIKSVWLVVTGGHIKGFNNRGSINLPEDAMEITEEDVEGVGHRAQEVSLPADQEILHTLVRGYNVDGHKGVMNPAGMIGRQLEADYHIIHGIRTRIQNAIRCVKECHLEVEGIAVGSVAAAESVLDAAQKENGAVVIDIGGGTTDYIAYANGSVHHSGVLAVGGDHLDSDISCRFRIPLSRAESLKLKEGSALLGGREPGGDIVLRNEAGFSGKRISREDLDFVIHVRVEEIFRILRKQIFEAVPEHLIGSGIFLTGGSSLLPGIRDLAESVFDLPVFLRSTRSVSGPASIFEDPRYSTAVGLTKYAEAVLAELGEDSSVDRMLGWIGNWFGMKS